MTEIYLDISDLDTDENIHNYFTETFEFPSYYGRNFDALYDMMSTIGEDTKLCIDFEGRKLDELPECTITCLKVLYDAADENVHLTIARTDDEERDTE